MGERSCAWEGGGKLGKGGGCSYRHPIILPCAGPPPEVKMQKGDEYCEEICARTWWIRSCKLVVVRCGVYQGWTVRQLPHSTEIMLVLVDELENGKGCLCSVR